MLLTNFSSHEMELPSKFLEQIDFKTRPKVEEHMLNVMNKSTHEEHLSQPLQTNNKQFKFHNKYENNKFQRFYQKM